MKLPAPIDRDAVTKRLLPAVRPASSRSLIRAAFIQNAEPHLQVLSDADRLADEIRDIVIETVPPPRIARDPDDMPHTPRERGRS